MLQIFNHIWTLLVYYIPEIHSWFSYNIPIYYKWRFQACILIGFKSYCSWNTFNTSLQFETARRRSRPKLSPLAVLSCLMMATVATVCNAQELGWHRVATDDSQRFDRDIGSWFCAPLLGNQWPWRRPRSLAQLLSTSYEFVSWIDSRPGCGSRRISPYFSSAFLPLRPPVKAPWAQQKLSERSSRKPLKRKRERSRTYWLYWQHTMKYAVHVESKHESKELRTNP